MARLVSLSLAMVSLSCVSALGAPPPCGGPPTPVIACDPDTHNLTVYAAQEQADFGPNVPLQVSPGQLIEWIPYVDGYQIVISDPICQEGSEFTMSNYGGALCTVLSSSALGSHSYTVVATGEHSCTGSNSVTATVLVTLTPCSLPGSKD